MCGVSPGFVRLSFLWHRIADREGRKIRTLCGTSSESGNGHAVNDNPSAGLRCGKCEREAEELRRMEQLRREVRVEVDGVAVLPRVERKP